MPAQSKSQQRLFGMVYAIRKKKLDKSDVPEEVRDIADSDMKTKDIKKFAKTKHKGLPERLKEALDA